MPKVEHLLYGDRKVFTVSSFNRGVGMHLGRLPNLWVEGEVTELRRNPAWANVFLTLKDPKTAATLAVTIARRTYERLDLDLDEGETVHVAGRAELFEQKAVLAFRATTIERLGIGGHLARARAAEAEARRRGPLRAGAEAAPATCPARRRNPHGRGRSRSRRPRGDDRSSLPGYRGRDLRDAGPGQRRAQSRSSRLSRR